MSELGDAGDLDDRVVAAGDQRREEVALRDPLAHVQVDPAAPELVGAERSLDERQERRDHDQAMLGRQGRQDAEPLGRLVVLGQRALERQGGAFGEDAQVTATKPGGEVVGDAVRLLVGARDDDERCRSRQGCAPRGEVGRPRRSGHAKDARLRQMGPKGVDERSDAAITAA